MAAGKKYGGRVAGTPNRATAEVKDLARAHGPAAILRLSELLTGAESEQAQVAAAKELLDRAYGKAGQAVEVSGPNGGPIETTEITDIQRAKAIATLIGKLKKPE